MVNTYFVDIDGTLLEHIEDFENIYNYESLKALPGAKEKTSEWLCQDCRIILTTGRPECMRELTEQHLKKAGIVYTMLIMGVGAGPRILINDYVDGKPHKAWAYNVLRNKDGIKDIP